MRHLSLVLRAEITTFRNVSQQQQQQQQQQQTTTTTTFKLIERDARVENY